MACLLTLVTQSRANRKVREAVANVKTFLFLLRILNSSVRPVITASMPPIWWRKRTGSKTKPTCGPGRLKDLFYEEMMAAHLPSLSINLDMLTFSVHYEPIKEDYHTVQRVIFDVL